MAREIQRSVLPILVLAAAGAAIAVAIAIVLRGRGGDKSALGAAQGDLFTDGYESGKS